MKDTRRRCEIIDLNTGLRYLNESVASESVKTSRYLIHKSITERKICKGVAFAQYYYGMDIETTLSMYSNDVRKNAKKEDN
jgi:predicted transcriptional regulator